MENVFRAQNEQRASRVADALQYRDYLECRGEEATAVRDLLADLRHYCDLYGIDFAEQDRIAHDNYLAELQDAMEFDLSAPASPPQSD